MGGKNWFMFFFSFLTLRAQKLKKFKISLGIDNFKRDWIFQASHPTNPYFRLVGNSEDRDWNFQARLKFSNQIENFKRDCFFKIRALWVWGRKKHINKTPPKIRGQSREILFTCFFSLCAFSRSLKVFLGSWAGVGNGPHTVSESTVSNTEVSEFLASHRVPGKELSEFLSAYYLWGKANSPSFSQNSPSLPPNSVRLREFSSLKQCSRNSTPPVS